MKRLLLNTLILFCGFSLFAQNDPSISERKMVMLMQMLRYFYVEPADMPKLVEKGTIEMLSQLDPHSSYITAADVKKANEPLQGNFDGIGVSFQIVKDTITIVEVIQGGPSEKLGIQAGDKIVRIDGIQATGDSASNDFVFRRLRGTKGTIVNVLILRGSSGRPMEYRIVRDKIPIHSVETAFMENKKTGYIAVQRFSKATSDEVRAAILELQSQGMSDLILDLRGNTGGYLDQAFLMAELFLPKGSLIVYMEGAAQPRQDYISEKDGIFMKGRVVVLIDEESASASEIVAGALQDHDRALVVGRRSFGKGLVQRPFNLPDGSEVRLTIARYYTPSGRCIQKPYNDGNEAYFSDIAKRYMHGEMMHPDSIQLPDSLRFQTLNNRVVYGGGGIMPDVFTPMDTTRVSDYYIDLRRTNVFNNFVMDYLDRERASLQAKYPDLATFDRKFNIDSAFKADFERYAAKAGVERNRVRKASAESFINAMFYEMKKDTALNKVQTYQEYVDQVLWEPEKMRQFLNERALKEDATQKASIETSDVYIMQQLKAMLARNLYGFGTYYQIIKNLDDAYKTALKVIENERLFKEHKITY